MWFSLVYVAFCFLFISKPLQEISSYNHRHRISDVTFWHLFLKSWPSFSTLQEVPPRKRQKIKIKPFLCSLLFQDIWIRKWITLELQLRDMRQFQDLFVLLKQSSLCSFFLVTVPLRFGNIWYFCIRLLMSNHLLEKCTVPLENYTKDILCVTATNAFAQITLKQ